MGLYLQRARKQWLLLVAALLCLAITFGYQIFQSRQAIESAEQIHLSSLAAISADILERHLSDTEAVLGSMARVASHAKNHQLLKQVSAEMQKFADAFPGTHILMALDANGTIFVANRDKLLGQNFSYRHYFSEAKEKNNPDVLIISPPFQTVLGTDTFTISRSIRGENGEFLGVLVATLDRTFLSKLLSTTRYAPDMEILVLHGNGKPILALPENMKLSAADQAALDSYFLRHRSSGLEESQFSIAGDADASNRLVSFHTILLPDQKLDAAPVIVISRSLDAIHAVWWEASRSILALLCLVIIASFYGLALYQRRSRAHWKLLERQEAILNSATDGIHVLRRDGQLVDANPRFITMLGLDIGSIDTINITEIDAGQTGEKVLSTLHSLCKTNEVMHIETQHRHRDGHLIDVEISSRSFENDGEILIFASSRDVSKRKVAEAHLHRYQHLVESSGEMLAMLDMEQRYLIVNPAYAKLAELPVSSIVGEHLMSTLGEVGYRQISPYIDVALHGEALDFVFLMERPGVAPCRLQVSTRPYFENDQQLGLVLGLHDITTLEIAQQTAERESVLAKCYLETAQSVMVALDPEGTIIMINAAGCRLLGWKVEELLGKNWFETCLPQPQGMTLVYPGFVAMMAGDFEGFEQFENHILCRDGSLRLIVWHNAYLKDERGCRFGVLSSGQDVTDQRANEAELLKLAQAIEQSPSSVMITNTESIIEYVNSAFCRMTGYGVNEVIGKKPNILQSGQTAAEIHAAMWSTLMSERTWQGEMINRKKNGEIYTEAEIIAPVRRADGTVTHFLALKEDVTEKNKNAEELEQYRRSLETVVAQRTSELVAINHDLSLARDDAETATLAKSAFLANMSHEIRTPMNAIIGFSHLLMKEPLSSTQSDRVGKIAGAAKHLLSVLNDILDISKIESGKVVLDIAPFQLSHLLDSLRGMIGDRLLNNKLDFNIDVAGLPEHLLGDSTRVTQVLLNYVGNALKFTNQGEIRLEGRLLGEDASGLLIRFSVSDTGIGIDATTLRRLFQAFEQAEVTTARRYGGTGLGLAINQKLAQLMGGEVGVESELGIGSTFWVTMRLQRSLLAMPVSKNGVDNIRVLSVMNGARVLIVEDNDINAEVLTELIGNEAHCVVERACNGAEAVEILSRISYDLVLMDMQMPVMDGVDATLAIRQLPGCGKTPIVAMTANAFEEDRQRCLAAGMNDHMAKPVDPAILFNMLCRWIPDKQRSGIPEQANLSDANDIETKLIAELNKARGLNLDAGLQSIRQKNVIRYLDFLKRAVDSNSDTLELLRESLGTGDLSSAGFRIHSLKGVSGTLGLVAIYQAACELDEALRHNLDRGDLLRLMAALDVVFEQTMSDLKVCLNTKNGLLGKQEGTDRGKP